MRDPDSIDESTADIKGIIERQFGQKQRERRRQEDRLAREVRSATTRLANARARRDAYIRARVAAGDSPAVLSRRFGISRTALYKILQG